MILVLAEKAKAARRIAHILSGGRYRTVRAGRISYFVFWKNGKEYVVFPLRGHVIDVDFPREFARWSLKRLKDLVNAPIEEKITHWDVIKVLKAMRNRVEGVIVATDADREGEAIGLEVVLSLFKGKPVARAWFSSLSPREVQRAFSNLIPPKRNLAEAAFARREVDLLWGAVLTRALSLTSGRRGKDFLSVGRVQTPTLALVVEREREIRNFVPKPYWILKARFSSFWAEHPKKIEEEKKARELMNLVRGKAGAVKVYKKEEKKVPRPVPFDTTTFLSEANKLLGIPPKEALDIAEDLYMSGLISYPRTDNQTYPSDLPFGEILGKLSRIPAYRPFAERIKPPYSPSRGRKTEDHPPIHPVDVPSSHLPDRHAKVYDLVVRRFLATLLPPGIVLDSYALIDVEGVPFEAKGRKVVSLGWMEAYPVFVEEKYLPELSVGDVLPVEEVKIEKKKTKPPSRYSPGELVRKMESLGLGTKATRAEIVAKLYRRGYISGRKRIRPTELGELVYDLLKELAPQTLSPELTASLEKDLTLVEQGKKERREVVSDTRIVLKDLVEEFLRRKDHIREVMRGGVET